MLVDALVCLVEHLQRVLARIRRVVLQVVARRVDARYFRNPIFGQEVVRTARPDRARGGCRGPSESRRSARGPGSCCRSSAAESDGGTPWDATRTRSRTGTRTPAGY